YSSNWDAQGLGFYREGAVWYRTRIDLPALDSGQGMGLFLGGFDDRAEVWLNGKYVGDSGRKFSRPAVFDLTEFVSTDKNLLVIKISRLSNINEALTGGLLRPVFVFSGPRIESGKETPKSNERVLPGGTFEKIK
ncbi:MAG: sugar-binding domain-containing protein, partial [Chthoniobacterales bacterium]